MHITFNSMKILIHTIYIAYNVQYYVQRSFVTYLAVEVEELCSMLAVFVVQR